MATLSKNILPIPESVVVGSGSYTVPGNKYACLQFFSAVHTVFASTTGANHSSSTSATQWLAPGTSVSAATQNLTNVTLGTSTGSFYEGESFAYVTVNGTYTSFDRSRPGALGVAGGTVLQVRCYAVAGWSISLFPIPVSNLPAELIT